MNATRTLVGKSVAVSPDGTGLIITRVFDDGSVSVVWTAILGRRT